MRVEVKFPQDRIDRFVKYVFAEQLPFVESLAVKQTGLQFQEAQRARLTEIFEQRRPRWQARAIKVTDWPTKAEPRMRIAVDAPGDRSDILGKFETETRKTPLGRAIAVPSENVPRTPSGVIRKGWRPKDLFGSGSGARSSIQGRGSVVQGARGTFLIENPNGKALATIFRRRKVKGRQTARRLVLGTRGGEVEVLYQFVRSVPIEPELEFLETAERVVVENWPDNFVDAFDRAIRTAR